MCVENFCKLAVTHRKVVRDLALTEFSLSSTEVGYLTSMEVILLVFEGVGGEEFGAGETFNVSMLDDARAYLWELLCCRDDRRRVVQGSVPNGGSVQYNDVSVGYDCVNGKGVIGQVSLAGGEDREGSGRSVLVTRNLKRGFIELGEWRDHQLTAEDLRVLSGRLSMTLR